MTELRQNPASKEWVIIAKERAKRPDEFIKAAPSVISNDTSKCPFCPGHEQMTPPEIFSFRMDGTAPDTPGWWVRVMRNKFSALEPGKGSDRELINNLYLRMDGIGEHEVIVESPDHEQTLATMPQKQVEEVFLACRQRYTELAKDKRFEMVILFKNHGASAGTSIHHPHSQMIATPVAPIFIRQRVENCMEYFDDKGSCVYCDMIKTEKEIGKRIILETERFLVFSPFASRSPFETMVIPKRHESTFEGVSMDETKELAYAMRIALKKLYNSLNNPDYNYVLFTSPCHERKLDYYHWHIKIFPRVSQTAGFEMGSGIYINTVVPEEAAEFLKNTHAD